MPTEEIRLLTGMAAKRVPEDARADFLNEINFSIFSRLQVTMWFVVILIGAMIYLIDIRGILDLAPDKAHQAFVIHVAFVILAVGFLVASRFTSISRADEIRPVHRILNLGACLLLIFLLDAVFLLIIGFNGDIVVFVSGTYLLFVVGYYPHRLVNLVYALNAAFFFWAINHFLHTTADRFHALFGGGSSMFFAWYLGQTVFAARVRDFLNARKIGEQARQLDERNVELDRKVREISRANADLVASKQRANRIFSALTEALPGTILEGKYRLDEKIGEGGFGVVFRSTHLALDRPIAVKVFRPSPGNDTAEAVEWFRLEGVSASRINHPNAVGVIDAGVTEDGIAYLVMELLVGFPLSREIRTAGKLSLRRCCDILAPVCDALAEAHRLGMVHRDIKPDNIFLHHGPNGEEIVKVVDFGIVKFLEEQPDSGEHPLTATGAVVGTPLYLAPERLEKKPYDGESDVYALGITLYEMICGHVPFEMGSSGALSVIMHHLMKDPPPLRERLPGFPESVDSVVLSALEKDPAQRPSMIQLAERFREAVEALPESLQGKGGSTLSISPFSQVGNEDVTTRIQTPVDPDRPTRD